jgi:hypothetical protein
VDGWGTTLRTAYNTSKRDAEDPFLQVFLFAKSNFILGVYAFFSGFAGFVSGTIKSHFTVCFLDNVKTVSMWTDNGAALDGEKWPTSSPPPKTAKGVFGDYLQLNWSQVRL